MVVILVPYNASNRRPWRQVLWRLTRTVCAYWDFPPQQPMQCEADGSSTSVSVASELECAQVFVEECSYELVMEPRL